MELTFDNIDKLNDERKKNEFLNRFSYGNDEEEPNVYMLREERSDGAERRTVIYAPSYVIEKYRKRGGFPLENGRIAYWSPEIMKTFSINDTKPSLNSSIDSVNNGAETHNSLYFADKNAKNDSIERLANTFEEECRENNKVKRDKFNKARHHKFYKHIVNGYEKFMDLKEIREFCFPFKGPTYLKAAVDIGTGVDKKGKRMASNADRIADMNATLYGAKKGEEDRGSEKGAFRHALWQAMIASRYGLEIAYDAASAHEARPYSDTSIRVFDSVDEADVVVDLLNNEIGRKIGIMYPGATNKELSILILHEFHNNGLYTAECDKDGKWHISKRKLSDSKHTNLETDYNKMDEYGFKPDDTIPKIGEYIESKYDKIF